MGLGREGLLLLQGKNTSFAEGGTSSLECKLQNRPGLWRAMGPVRGLLAFSRLRTFQATNILLAALVTC